MAVLILVNIISIMVCFLVARYRGLNVWHWSLYALLLGPLVVPFVFFVKAKPREV